MRDALALDAPLAERVGDVADRGRTVLDPPPLDPAFEPSAAEPSAAEPSATEPSIADPPAARPSAAGPCALHGLPTRPLFGLPVVATVSPEAADAVLSLVAAGGHAKVGFLNAHAANIALTDVRLRAALRSFVLLPDGVGVDLAARLLHGGPFPENLNGTDFVPFLLRRAATPLSVGLLGARPDVVMRARDRFAAAHPRHTFRVVHHGYFPADEGPRIVGPLAADPVDVLLVALGNPAQETFIAETIDARHCRVAFGIGALFDFTSGRVPRAPRLLRDLRLEWMFRLVHEPRRMWRRYMVGNPVFLARVLRERSRRG